MPRRLIIGILVVLIVGVIGGTAYFVIQRLRGPAPVPTAQVTSGPLTEAPAGPQQVARPTDDDDSDGLNNADEALWGTNPANPDTDADGFLDGQEVANNFNPTIPSPNDKLPEGFQPGQQLTPLAEAPVQVEQFFAEGLDLSGGTENLTEKYNQQFPEDQRTDATLLQFVNAQPIVTSLPRPRAESVRIAVADTPVAVNSYYSSFAEPNSLLNPVIVREAIFNHLITRGDPSYVYGLINQVQGYQEQLAAAQVPPSAAQTHQVLLGLSELMLASLNQIARYDEDQAKALVAMNQLDAAYNQYIPLVRQEFTRLAQLNTQLNPPPDFAY